MSQHNSRFVRSQLIPESTGGGASPLSYQITDESAHPTIVVGVNEAGMPIEETVPPGYWEWWVGLGGVPKRVPMRTAAVYSQEPEAERYALIMAKTMILAGQMPAWVCPYTFEYKHIKGGPLAKAPAGVSDCGGSGQAYRHGDRPKVCEHMQKVMDIRLAAALAEYDKTQKQTMSDRQAENMIAGMAKAFGTALNDHAKTAKANLRAGKGEE